jgi:hypothetical protein
LPLTAYPDQGQIAPEITNVSHENALSSKKHEVKVKINCKKTCPTRGESQIPIVVDEVGMKRQSLSAFSIVG